MSSVDNRIVQMQFDNAKFENGVSTSINSIDKLKQALQFNDAGKGFDNITKAASSVDLSAVQNSIGAIEQKFSIVSEAIRRNVGKVIDKLIGKATQLANALFVAPRTDGFKEYELKMGSVQTIMASTGATLEEVNSYLEELNTYADKTIYSFSDMTANIGKFTNAGVKLDVAVKAIQGISNEAAISGANSAEASRAMYNFAQALSSGAVKLIDWKSIENANMATVEFKQELLDTAVALGTVVKDGDKYRSVTTDLSGKVSEAFTATSLFNESLAHQWMTTDVLTTTLGRYADASTELGKKAFAAAQDVKTWSQLLDTLKEAMGSGWSQSFEILIGDFNEAKELFTMISNTLGGIIDKSAKVRNGFLKMWDDKGGREKLIKQLETILGQIDILSDKVLKNILGSKYNKILGETNDILDDTTKKVDNLTEAEKKFVEEVWLQGLHGTGEQRAKEAEDLGLSYERIQNVLGKIVTGETTIDSLASTTAESTEKTANAVEEIKDSKWSDAFSDALTTIKFLGKSLLNIGETVLNIGKLFVQAFVEEFAIDDVAYGIKNFARYLMQATGRIKDWSKDSSGILTIFKGIFKFANALWRVLSPFLTFAGKAIRQIATWLIKVGDAIDEWSNKIDKNSRLYRAWNAIKTIAGKVKDAFLDMFKKVGDAVDNNPHLDKFKDKVASIKEGLKGFIDSGLDKVVDFLETLAEKDISFDGIVNFIKGLGTGEGKVSGFFDKLKSGNGVLSKFAELWKTMKESFSQKDSDGVFLRAYIWAKSAGEGLIEGIKSINLDKILKGLKLGAFLLITYQLYSILNSLNGAAKGFKKGALKILGSVNDVVSSFALEIKAKALKTVAESIALLAGTLMLMTLVDSQKLTDAAVALTMVLIAMAAIVGLLHNSNKLFGSDVESKGIYTSIDTTFLGIAAIIFALNKAVQELGSMNPDALYQGLMALLSMEVIVGLMITLIAFLSNYAKELPKAGGLILSIAASMLLIGKAIEIIANAGDNTGYAVLAVMGIITLLGMFVYISQYSGNMVAIGGGMLMMSLSLLVIAGAISALTLLPVGKLWSAIGVITALFTLIGALSVITGKTKTDMSLLKIAAGLMVMAVAIIYIGKHILTFVTGVVLLTAALVALLIPLALMSLMATQLDIVALALLGISIAMAIGAAAFLIFAIAVGTLGDSLSKLANGFIDFATKINGHTPQIILAVESMIVGVAAAIIKNAGTISKAIGVLIYAVLVALANSAGDIAAVIVDVVFYVLDIISELLVDITDKLIKLLIKFLEGLAKAIDSNAESISRAIGHVIYSLLNLIGQVLLEALNALTGGMFDDKIKELKSDMTDRVDELYGEDLGNEAYDNMTAAGEKAALGLQDGTLGSMNDLVTNLKTQAGPQLFNAGSDLGDSLIAGTNEGTSGYSDMFSRIGGEGAQSLLGTLPQYEDASDKIAETVNGTPIKIKPDYSEMQHAMGKAAADGATGMENYDAFFNSGDFNMDSYTEGMNYNVPDYEQFMNSLGKDGASWTMNEEAFSNAGSKNIGDMMSGMREEQPAVRRTATQTSGSAVEEIENSQPRYYSAGQYVMSGFIDGLESKKSAVLDKIIEIAQGAVSAAEDELEVKSPSKVFTRIGQFVSEGLSIGIMNYSDRVSDSSSSVANTAIDALKTPLSHITDILNGNLVVDPTIRPVLDLTELQNGTGMINDLFANRSVQLAGATAKLNDFNNTMIFDAKRNQNRDVVDEMRSLRSDVNALADKMDTLQVVMDSGQLVGAISSPMDAALGQRAIRKGRRN